MSRIAKAGGVYFLVVFATAFVFGIFRVSVVVPQIGERFAELIEMPFLFVVIVFAAKWLVIRFAFNGRWERALLAGILAAMFLLVVEFSVVLWIRGLTLEEFFAGRDSVAGVVYYAMVIVFAVAPALFAGRKSA
jgi:hypothetical protein